jgi:hypothetical protein
MTRRLLVLALLLLWGCAPHGGARARPWEAQIGAGSFPVLGARRSAPGPTIYRALGKNAAARRVLAGHGVPDSLRVVCGSSGRARVVLSYGRSAGAGSRQLVAEPAGGARRVCRPPRAVAARRADTPKTLTRRDAPSALPPAPTARQSLECPIDPARADCRLLCNAHGAHEWCR